MAKLSSCRLWLACFAVAVAVAGATQFTVGGANGWSVPTAGAESFNTWAERTRFQVGDSLVFVYPKDQDSVLLVEPSEYNACNTSEFVQRFADGNTVYTLDRPGALFFISGVEANCRNNEKLIVMVLTAGRNGTGGGGGAPAPTTPAPPPPASPTTPAPPPASPSPPPPVSAAPPPPSPPAPMAPTAASPPPATSASVPPPASAPTTPAPPPAPTASPPTPASPAAATPPSAPAGTPPAPTARSPAPSAQGTTTTANSTGTPPSSPRAGGSEHKNGAALAVATGFSSSVVACVLGYAMLAL